MPRFDFDGKSGRGMGDISIDGIYFEKVLSKAVNKGQLK